MVREVFIFLSDIFFSKNFSVILSTCMIAIFVVMPVFESNQLTRNKSATNELLLVHLNQNTEICLNRSLFKTAGAL